MNEPSARERDQLMVPRLTGAAWRHAPGREPTGAETAAAVAELREIVGGRGDLLAEVAGLLIGYYRRTAQEPRARAAAYYCMAAGADARADPAVDRGGMRPRGRGAADPPGRIRRTAGVRLARGGVERAPGQVTATAGAIRVRPSQSGPNWFELSACPLRIRECRSFVRSDVR